MIGMFEFNKSCEFTVSNINKFIFKFYNMEEQLKEQLISFETAKLAKEKEFRAETGYYYDVSGKLHERTIITSSTDTCLDIFYTDLLDDDIYFNRITAPTQSLLQKWLREIHNIHFEIKPIFGVKDNLKPYHISVMKNPSGKGFEYKIVGSLDTYEETLEIGLQEALKLIK